MNKIKRIPYLDYLRFFACLSVVLIHIFTTARTDFSTHTLNEDYISRVIPQLLHFAVPIFFMITGVLFLNEKKEFTLKEYFKKYILKYAFVILIFSFGYAFIEEIFNGNLSLSGFINAFINMLRGKSWAHMWYMYSLFGVMLVIPFVKQIIRAGKNYTIYLMIILFISSVIYPTFKLFNFNIGVSMPLNSIYLFYAVLGYYLNEYENISDKRIVSLIGAVISVILIFVLNYISVFKGITILSYVGDYDSIVIVLFSVSLFSLFKNMINEKINKPNKFIKIICKESFGIYLIHMFYINLIYKFFKYNIYGDKFVINAIVIYFIVLFVSTLSSYLFKKIPYLGKVIE